MFALTTPREIAAMSVVDEVKQRLDIVDLIGEYVALQKSGRNYKALCPFHTEKTPSFVIFTDTQSWHCFGACSTGGDIFSFVMRQENVDFSEALRFLARRAGVELRPLDQAQLQRRDALDRLRAVNAAAAQYYHRTLMTMTQGERAKRYLEGRGVTTATMATFQLGYAPDQWHALEEYLRREHFSLEDIQDAGLLSESEGGNVYDRFRGRVMFPIRDGQGRVIGFGARALDDSPPKYINTPQTSLFSKGTVLYGIDLARESIRETGTAVIVEGYMGVILPHQCGVTNLVACMGTALTPSQIDILKRMTRVLILALDADSAGLRAAERGAEIAHEALEHRVVPVPTATGLVRYEEHLDAEIRILMLPDGLDPDELILEDRARWDGLVSEALPVADFFFQLVEGEVDTSTARGKREAMDRLLPIVAAMDNLVERTHYLQRLARWIHVDERELLPHLDRLLRREARGSRSARDPGRRWREATPSTPAERLEAPTLNLEERCLALLVQAPELLPRAREVSSISPETFQDVRNRQVFEALAPYLASHPEYSQADFRDALDSELNDHVESLSRRLLSGPPLSPEMIQEDLMKCSTRLRKNQLARLIRELRFMQQDAQEDGLEDGVRELNRAIDQLTRDHLEIDQRYYAATLIGRSKREPPS